MLRDINECDYNVMINNDVTMAYIIVSKSFSSWKSINLHCNIRYFILKLNISVKKCCSELNKALL